jgi:hypothetical protein
MTNRSASRSTEIVTAALEISAQVSVKSTLAEKSKRVPHASAPCSRKLSSKIVRTAASSDKSRASDPRTPGAAIHHAAKPPLMCRAARQ